MTTGATSTLDCAQIRLKDLPRDGGKSAFLGQLWEALKLQGVGVVDGLARTAKACRPLLAEDGLEAKTAGATPVGKAP